MNSYITVLKKYAVFEGRARRQEYWMFVLFNLIIAFVLGFVDGLLFGQQAISLVYQLAVLIPSIAAGVRRMHDSDHSGWWIIVPFVNLYFAVIDGTPGPNSYGNSPKLAAA